MAIPFLNNINLTDNQLLNAKLQVSSSAPTSAAGQIYFSTSLSENRIRVHNDSEFKAVAWYDDIPATIVESLTLNPSTFITLSNIGTSTDPSIIASLSATGTPSSSTFLRGDNTWGATPNDNTTYTLPVAAGGSNTAVINLTAGGSGSGVASSVTFSGTTNEVEVTETVGDDGTITIGLPNNVVIAETLTTGGNLTVNTTGVSNNLKLVSTDTTIAGAPDLVLFADAAAQNGDTLGTLLFQGKNGMVPASTDPLTYAGFFAHMADASNNHSVLALTMHKGNGPGAQDTAMNFSLIGNNNSAEGALYINPPSGYAFPSYNLEVNGTSRFVGNATFNSNVTVDGNLTVTGTVTTLNETVKVVENNTIEFEGVTDNEFEIKLTGGDPTADHTVTLPDASGTIALTSDIKNGTLTVQGSNGLTGTGTFTANDSTSPTITISHADTSSQASVDNSGRTYIQDITLDDYGHITAIASATETVVNTDNQLATAAALIDVSAMGTNTTASFTHGLASKNLIVQMYDVTTGEVVFADVDHTSINAISVIFAQTPTNDIRVVVIDAKNSVTDSTVTYS